MFRYRVVGTAVRNALGVATVFVAFILASCGEKAEESAAPTGAVATIDRTVLPIAEPTVVSIAEMDARKATPPARFEVKAPEGAPNVVIVLIDDIGFGFSSAFGGPIRMPTLEKLANRGLRYNRFHTTALCSPTRTALLTGRNHHVNNAGAIWSSPPPSRATPACGRTVSHRWRRSSA